MVQTNHQTTNSQFFRSRATFNKGYLPETFLYRDAQNNHLEANLEPAFYGGEVINTILRGPAGTGKTTCVLREFEKLRNEQATLEPVTVNCQECRTECTVMTEICRQLLGFEPAQTGIATRTYITAIYDYLNKRGHSLVVFLDDVDYLLFNDALKPVFSRLLRMCGKNAGVRVSIIASASTRSFDIYDEVDPATQALLHMDMIQFPAYSEEEMAKILMKRVDKGLLPGVIAPELVQEIARRSYAASDIRLGIEVINEAALAAEAETVKQEREEMLAGFRKERGETPNHTETPLTKTTTRTRMQGKPVILPEDVNAAFARATRAKTGKKVRDLKDPALRVLWLMATAKQNHPEILMSRHYFRGMNEIEPVSFSTYIMRRHELVRAGLLSLKLRDYPGRTNLITLVDAPDLLLMMCDDARLCHEKTEQKRKARIRSIGRRRWYRAP